MPDLSSEVLGVPVYPSAELKVMEIAEQALTKAVDNWKSVNEDEVTKLEQLSLKDERYKEYVSEATKDLTNRYRRAGYQGEISFQKSTLFRLNIKQILGSLRILMVFMAGMDCLRWFLSAMTQIWNCWGQCNMRCTTEWEFRPCV